MAACAGDDATTPLQPSIASPQPFSLTYGVEYFRIRNRVSDLCLGVTGKNEPGAALAVYPCWRHVGGNIHWRFEKTQGRERVRNRISDYCLGVRGVDSHGPGGLAEIYDCTPKDSNDPGQDMTWVREPMADGFWRIENGLTQLCLGVQGVDKHGDDAHVEVFGCASPSDPGHDNQWRLEPVSEPGCHMNHGAIGQGEGDLDLLVISLHHRAKPDQLSLAVADLDVLADEIVDLAPDPTELVIPLVNTPARFDLETFNDPCGTWWWGPSTCLRDRLARAYGVDLTVNNLGVTLNNAAIITGPGWELLDTRRVPFPPWVRAADRPIGTDECPAEGQPTHYAVFDLRKRTAPFTQVRIYSVYLCVQGGDWTPKAKMLRYVMNVAADDGTGDVAPFVVGDWNQGAVPSRPDAAAYAERGGDKSQFYAPAGAANYHLGLTVQQELRNRTNWIDDVNNNACQREPFHERTADRACGCRGALQPEESVTNSCADPTHLCSFWTCLPWQLGDGFVHLAQLRDPKRPLMVPVYHPFWRGTLNTVIGFSTVAHRAHLTTFDGTLAATAPSPFDVTLGATAAGMKHACGQGAGASWVATAAAHNCWMVDGPRGPPWFWTTQWTGYRVGFRGVAAGGARVRFNVIEEERPVAWTGTSTSPIPDVLPQGPLRVTALDETVDLHDGPFCRSFTISGLELRYMAFRVALEAGAKLQLDAIRTTDLWKDPCAP